MHDDDDTPRERLSPADALHRTLVATLTNHILALTNSVKIVTSVRGELVGRTTIAPSAAQLEALGEAFRAEGDSAHAVARAAELAAKGPAGNGTL